MNTNISVTNISLNGELHISQPIVRDCYRQGIVIGSSVPTATDLLVPAMFPIADGKNKFIAIGCDTFGLIGGVLNGSGYVSGCISMCLNESMIGNEKCLGNGCCELEIPNGLMNLKLLVGSFFNHSLVKDFNPCGYAFVVGNEGFEFDSKYVRSFQDVEVEVVVGWAIGNESNYVCGLNSKRNYNFSNDGREFRCQCLEGFQGNPYLPQGCQGKKSYSIHYTLYFSKLLKKNTFCIHIHLF